MSCNCTPSIGEVLQVARVQRISLDGTNEQKSPDHRSHNDHWDGGLFSARPQFDLLPLHRRTRLGNFLSLTIERILPGKARRRKRENKLPCDLRVISTCTVVTAGSGLVTWRRRTRLCTRARLTPGNDPSSNTSSCLRTRLLDDWATKKRRHPRTKPTTTKQHGKPWQRRMPG